MLLCPGKMPAEKPLLISKVIEIFVSYILKESYTRNKRETLTGKQGAKDFQAILSRLLTPYAPMPYQVLFVCLFVCLFVLGSREYNGGFPGHLFWALNLLWRYQYPLSPPIFLPYQVFCCIVKVALGRRQVVHKTSHHVTTENDFYLQGMKLLKQDAKYATQRLTAVLISCWYTKYNIDYGTDCGS